MKKHLASVLTAAAALAPFTASALSFSQMAAAPAIFSAPGFSTATPALAYVATDSIANVRLKPLGLSGTYFVVSKGGSATVQVGGASTFSFLWGSPDLFNSLILDTSSGIETFTGLDFQTLFGIPANGSNANTRLITIAGDPGQWINNVTFASSGIAFELNVVSAVPEPETFALLLGGLLLCLYVANRTDRNRQG